jgi:hypothetical protein
VRGAEGVAGQRGPRAIPSASPEAT